jgi:hypothetical protein
MQSISNISRQNYQDHFIQPITNFYGKIISLVDQKAFKALEVAPWRISESAKRVASIVVVIFGLLGVCYLTIKYLSETNKNAFSRKQISTTLTTEFSSAKQRILVEGRYFEKGGSLNFENAVSAKIFLIVDHQDRQVVETEIFQKIDEHLSHDLIEKDFIARFDLLFDKLQKNIQFNERFKTNFTFGVLLKDREVYQGQPTFSSLFGGGTVHQGKASNFSGDYLHKTMLLNDANQQIFCEFINIPVTPQLDTQGNFI